MEINRKQLMKILDEYDGVAWKDLPKIIANFGTILGSHSVTGKAYKDRGRYLLLRQRNSSRGPVIVDQFGGMDTTHLTFINKQGNAYCWWTEISWISPFSLKGKEAADSLDYVSA
jgi:putative heme iron utilization protein